MHENKSFGYECHGLLPSFIQVLKFLEKQRRKREALSPWKEPKGLTEEQRLAFQQKVDDYIRLHPVHL